MVSINRILSTVFLIILITFLSEYSLANTWISKSPMLTARHALTVNTVHGKVYAIGGHDLSHALGVNEEYTPETDTWLSKKPMPTVRWYINGGVVNDRIYVFGGFNDDLRILNVVEEYDPVDDIWSSKAPMPTQRANMGCVTLDHKIYVIGGRMNDYPYGPKTESNAVEVYDPFNNSWEIKSPMPTPRQGLTCSVVNGKIIAFGGYNEAVSGDQLPLDVVEEYDPDTDSWKTLGSMPVAHYGGPSWSAVIDGQVYLFTDSTKPNYIYNPTTSSWLEFAQDPISRRAYAVNMLGADVYVIGGLLNPSPSTGHVNLDTVQIFKSNTLPIAVAGDDQTAHVGDLITLDGSASDDLDENYPITYAWEVVSAPAGSTATITDVETVLASFRPDVVGDYTIQLIVTDSLGLASAPDTVIVSTTNSRPVADAGLDQVIVEIGAVVTLDGTQSDDSDDDPLTYSWQLTLPNGSFASLDDPTSLTPSFIADIHADFSAQLVVNDGWIDSMPDSVLVSFDNVAPVADAGGNQSVVIGETVYLNGSGTDANHDSLDFGWAIVSAPDGSLATLYNYQEANTSFVPDCIGNYVLNLMVSDGIEISEPSSVTVTVISQQTAIADLLQNSIGLINDFNDDELFKKNSDKTITNYINQTLNKLDSEEYELALDHLEKILVRIDGCALRDEPDANPPQNERDWVTTCEAQTIVYPLLKEAYDYLVSLVDAS